MKAWKGLTVAELYRTSSKAKIALLKSFTMVYICQSIHTHCADKVDGQLEELKKWYLDKQNARIKKQ